MGERERNYTNLAMGRLTGAFGATHNALAALTADAPRDVRFTAAKKAIERARRHLDMAELDLDDAAEGTER